MNLANSLFERIADFLEEYPPFQYMQKVDLIALSRAVKIKFHEKDEVIFEEGNVRKQVFFIINKGAVRVSSRSGNGRSLTDLRQAGELLGTGHLVDEQSPYVNTAITAEDTILYVVPWKPFAEMLPMYPDVVRYLKAIISLRSDLRIPSLVDKADFFPGDEISGTLVGRLEEATKLSQYAKARFVTCKPEETMQEVAFKMISNRSEAIVVVDSKGSPLGMVTKTDMTRAVQSGRSPADAPALEFMSSPVITVESNPRLGSCLRIMLKSGFQHICLTEDGTSCSPAYGVISERDLMLYYGNNPMVIIRQIAEINSFVELSHMRHRADMLILHELRHAKDIDWFAEVVHDLNRAFVKKVIRLAMDSLRIEGQYMPQSSFCLFFAGSGGRMELFTRSAMDRGLVYQADFPKDQSYCAAYYRKLSARIHEGLHQCGWTVNDAGYTEKNEKWCQPLDVWLQYFSQWIEEGATEATFESLHWFDLLAADGLESLVRQIFDHRKKQMHAHPDFFRKLATQILARSPGSSDLERFNKREQGKQPEHFDLLQNVIHPVMHMARLLAHADGIHDIPSTYGRLQALAEKGDEHSSLYLEAGEGFRIAVFVMARKGLRDQSPGNWIDPGELSPLENQWIKSTFRSVISLQNLIETRFLGT